MVPQTARGNRGLIKPTEDSVTVHGKQFISAGILMVALAGLAGNGCSTVKAVYTGHLASVDIGGGHTREKIVTEVVSVFRGEGFAHASSGSTLVFQRRATEIEKLAYGSNVGNGHVVKRAQVRVLLRRGGVYRLECDVFMVRDAGQRHEDKVRLKAPRSGPYQKMLDTVVEQLTPLTETTL